jgi:gamma-glutamylputrescine oxidase
MVMNNVPVWAGDDALHLPELDGEVSADVCVVGLGGSGLACVNALLAGGKRVVGIVAVTGASGAAGRNGGFLLGGLAMFHHEAQQRLGQAAAKSIYEETLKQIVRMTAETPEAVRRTGSLRIAASEQEAADCDRHFDAMRSDALPVERYDGPEGQGLLFPADAAFDPARRCAMLAAQALELGAQLYSRSPAVELDGDTVITPRGRVRADRVVVAVDGRLESVLPELAPRVRSVRLQMLATAPTSELSLPRPVYSRWGMDYWQQRADMRVVLGGCRDVGGDAEFTTDARPTDEVQDALTALLRTRLQVTAPVTHRWAATVGYTTSGMPVLEEVRPGVWAVGAYSGTGNVIGALCGRAVAELIVNGRSEIADALRAQQGEGPP